MADKFNILTGPKFKSSTFLSDLDISLDDYLLNVMQERGDEVYMIDASSANKTLTTLELVNQSYNLATELQNLGSKPGVIIGIISENRLEFPSIFLAAIMTGATFTCFNPSYTTGELRHMLGISQPSIVFCSSQNYNKLKQTNELVSCIKHIILIDTEQVDAGTESLFSNLIGPSSKTYQKIINQSEDTAVILYSSGTTGFPKGVMLTHRNCVFMLKMIREENVFETDASTTINPLPMFHSFGLFVSLQSLVLGQKLVIMRRYNEELFLSMIQQYKVKFLYVVPTLVFILLKNASAAKCDYDLSSVEQIFCGGASVRDETERKLREKLKLKYFRQIYGMTEATYVITLNTPKRSKKGTCGSPLPGVQIKIRHLNTGDTLGVGETGEICIKGLHVMKGYYRNEEATCAMLNDNGWLHTGDIGYYDEDGDLFIIDREKDLIKYKGYQVSPTEIEALLLQYPYVNEVAVIGVRDDVAGEIPKAFVKKQEGSVVTEDELVQFIAGLVSPAKRLRGGVTFVDEIPRNPTGKILRRLLR